MSDEILTERRGRVLVITFNRPESRNAVNLAVSQGLVDAVDELDDSADLSVAVITGAGGNFCVGLDLKTFAAGEVVAIPGRGIGFTERPPRKPLISAVEGYALAGGTEVVLATDLVVASRSAKFGIPEVKRGLVAAGEGKAWGFVNVVTEPNHSDLHLQRRQGGRDRVRREARARVDQHRRARRHGSRVAGGRHRGRRRRSATRT